MSDIRIHDQRHRVIAVDPFTLSTLEFDINALYQRILILKEQKKSNDMLMKETKKQFNEKIKLKRKLDNIKHTK